jgi:hypothetical protein
MKVDRVFVLSYLKEKQIEQGGYYGSDLSDLAKLMKVTYRAVRMRLTKWIKEDPDFFNLIYLGKSLPSITLDEFIEIKDRIQSNPLELKKHLLFDIRDKRELRGEDTLSTATFYRRANQVELSLFINNESYRWFSERKIKIPSFYPALLTRGTKLRSLLTSIPPAQQEEIQARIIFEIQVAFVVECKDVLITELLHRKGRDQQSMDDSRQRLQNSIRKREIDSIRSDIGDMVTLSGPDMKRLKEIAYPSIGEEELSKMELLRGKKKNYELILDVLNRLTNGMREDVTFHTENSQRIDDLGYLILLNVSRIPIPIHDICNAVELSNYLKKKTRIVEASYTRVEKHEAGLLLKSSELVISIAGLYHLITGWKGPESPFNLSDIRLYIPA